MKYTCFSALLLAGSQLAAQSPAIQQEKTNVLMILVDDLSTLLNCYGHEQVITPHVDKLASQGRMFERAYCQSAVCNPSRASFMTGKYPHELGIWTNQPHFRGFFPKIKTLSEHFMDHGYYSVGIGKVFHNWGQSIQGDPQSWSEPQRYHYAAHYHDWYVPGRPYQLHFDLEKGPAVQCEDVPDEAYLDGRIAGEAINKLRELREKPFFMAVGFWKPHLPFNAPKKYWDMYERSDFAYMRYPDRVEGVPDIAWNNSHEVRTYTDVPNSGEISEEKKLELRHGYYAAITYLDAQLGKLLDELDRLGLIENTVVVLFSDHGYHAGEFGEFGKLTNFESGTRVPLIIAYRGMPHAGESTQALTELVDIYPTLIDLCGLPSPAAGRQLSGTSLRPILDNPAASVKAAALSQISRPLGVEQDFDILGSSIRTATHRYNIWVHRSDGSMVADELYDLEHDIYQVENLSNDLNMESFKEKLNGILLRELKQKKNRQ